MSRDTNQHPRTNDPTDILYGQLLLPDMNTVGTDERPARSGPVVEAISSVPVREEVISRSRRAHSRSCRSAKRLSRNCKTWTPASTSDLASRVISSSDPATVEQHIEPRGRQPLEIIVRW